MAKNIVRDTDTGYKGIMKLLKGLGGRVEAGYIEGISSPDASTKAFLNETGVGNRPSRPFLGPAFDEMRYKVAGMVSGSVSKELKQRPKSPSRATRDSLARIGRVLGKAIQYNIMAKQSPPNAPSTVRQKGSDDPLIDTGEMLEEVAYRVRGPGGQFLEQEKLG